jgi:hypothetical protein
MTEAENTYLWDKSGAATPEIERLESVLIGFRYQSQPLAWERMGLADRPRARFFGWRWRIALSAFAVLLIAAAVSIQSRFAWRPGEPWRVSAITGTPRIANARFTGNAKLPVGQMLETDATSRARLHVASLGVIDVEPGTRLRLLATTTKRHRLALDYGTISARMWAPPFSLAIETESAAVFDLGCAFTVHAEPGGYGTVHVTSGWIEFESADRSVIVPAGAQAITRPGIGPGTPYFTDAVPAFKVAISEFDAHPDDAAQQSVALDHVLSSARLRDAFTLLNLFHEVTPEQRPRVLDGLASFVPIPAGYTRDDLLSMRQNAIAAYWNDVHAALHLDNPKSWIMRWKDVLGD